MEKKFTYVVIDDDILAHNVLDKLISKFDFLSCIGSCYDGFAGMSMLIEKKPDLLFLDIEMPGMTGLDLLEVIDKSVKVIVVSSFSDYAVDTYLYQNVCGFLKKPIRPDALSKTLSNVLQLISNSETTKEQKPTLSNSSNFLFVKGSFSDEKLYFNDILMCKANGNIVDVARDDNKIFRYNASLKKITDTLPTEDFVRISKNTIISIRKIKCKKGNDIELIDNSIHPIGMEYIEQFESKYNFHFSNN
ncbi:MAG: LytR/AlgR family response regulator transcription factor [Bacteroidales bacterium]